MIEQRSTAKERIEKLVRYFEEHSLALKSSVFNETQTRQQLIDPFFEALGWDVHNSLLKPPHLQEVIPEARVKTAITKEGKEQQHLFPSGKSSASEQQEYESILDYIAEDAYQTNSKEATKNPTTGSV